MVYSCIVVDDDEMSRNLIRHFISKTDSLDLKEEFDNAIEASQYLKSESVDIVFLDIQMPQMTGMEFIQTLEDNFEIIFITSMEDYAVEAFEKSVTDYLVKPVEYARFLQAVYKAGNNLDATRGYDANRKEFYIRSDQKLVRVPLDSILYVEALADYVVINTSEHKHIVHFTMKGIESRLPRKNFIRVHRSYIINLDKVASLEDNALVINEKSIPIGASYKEGLMKKLNLL
jgi:DNA-binding LytR/AlgR family response regulator